MVSCAQTLVNARARYLEKPLLAAMIHQPTLRAVSGLYARLAYWTRADMQTTPTRLGAGQDSVPALWCDAGARVFDGVILYLHGGAYTVGGAASHAHLAAHLAGICGMRALLVNYRLAPEHPFPAAPQDALTAYRALLAKGYRGDQIVIAGDSAGGGLAYALLHQLLRDAMPAPRCLVAISPWVDLEFRGASITDNRRSERMLPLSWLRRAQRLYLAGADPSDPLASPLHGTFAGAPPSLILVGAEEILRDDSRRMAARLRAAGAEACLIEQPGVPHIWPTHIGHAPEAGAALDRIAAFIRSHFNADLA